MHFGNRDIPHHGAPMSESQRRRRPITDEYLAVAPPSDNSILQCFLFWRKIEWSWWMCQVMKACWCGLWSSDVIRFTYSSSDQVVFHDFVISPETNFSVFAALNGVKSSVSELTRACRSEPGCRELCGPLCLMHLRPPRCELCDCRCVHEEKERKAGSSLPSVKCPFVMPGTRVPRGHKQEDWDAWIDPRWALCCPSVDSRWAALPELWFCQQGEKGYPGETGLPGNIGYPGNEGDQGKLGEKVTDIPFFFLLLLLLLLLSYRVPAQSSLYLFLLYYILLQSFFLNGNPIIKHLLLLLRVNQDLQEARVWRVPGYDGLYHLSQWTFPVLAASTSVF